MTNPKTSNIYAGLIVYHRPYLKTIKSITDMLMFTVQKDPNINIQYEYEHRKPILYAIQCHARRAIAEKADYFFLLHDDIIYPRTTIFRLLEHKKPIVKGWAFTRNHHLHQGLFKFDKDGKTIILDEDIEGKELITTPICGGGAMLMNKKVLNDINWEDRNIISNNGVDRILSKWINDAGYDIWVDKTIKLGHVISHEMVINRDTIEIYRDLIGAHTNYDRDRKTPLKDLIEAG